MTKQLKYIHVVEAFSTGVLSWIVDVASHQAAEGHDVIIAHSLRSETPGNYQQLFPDSVAFVQLPMGRDIHPYKDLISASKIARLIRKEKPDVVHLHSSKAGFVGRLGALLALTRVPVFYTPHGLAHLRQDVSLLKRWLFLSIEQLAGLLPGKVLACSKGEYTALKRILPSRWILRLDNAIDCSALRSRFPVQRQFGNEVSICALGGIRYQKAPWVFAELARRMGHQLDGVKIRWVWIGNGEEQYVTQLQQAGVEITGWLDREDALSAVNDCDIYLQTSLWEGLPLSVLEAQCLGLPAVVSDCEGNREAISDGQSGFVAVSPDDYVDSLSLLIRSPDLREQFSQQARQWIEQQFSLDRLLAELDKIYRTSGSACDQDRKTVLLEPKA